MRASGTLRVGRRKMYKSFRVKNFRCFKDLQINDLGRVNLIAGKNNTGKTALMEAFQVMARPLSPEPLNELQGYRDITISEQNRSENWRNLFPSMDTDLEITLESNDNSRPSVSRILTLREYSASQENTEHMRNYIRDAQNLGRNIESSVNLFESSLLQMSFHSPKQYAGNVIIYVPSTTKLPAYAISEFDQKSLFLPVQGRLAADLMAESFSALDLAGHRELLIGTVAVLEPDITELRLQYQSGEPVIWAETSSRNLPLKLMGEGVNRFFVIATTMISAEPTYLFIDEIENGIHYSVQKEIWQAIGRVARELDIQVFATTHSLEMIRAAHEAFKDDDVDDFRFHRLYRDSTTGNIEARTYNEYSIGAAISRKHEVRG